MKIKNIHLLILLLFLNSTLLAQEFEYFGEISCFAENQKKFQYNSGLAELAIDKFNNIFIYDPIGGSLIKLDSKRTFIKKWTSFDYKENQLIKNQNPTSNFNILKSGSKIKLDFEGNLYLYGEGPIHKFTPDGVFIKSIKSRTDVEDIAFDSFNNIYGISYKTIYKFDKIGNLISSTDLIGPEELESVRNHSPSLALDSLGNFYILIQEKSRIYKFSNTGKFINFVTKEGELSGEGRLFIDSKNHLYVSDIYKNRIQCFDLNGNFKFIIGRDSSIEKKIVYPHSFVVDSKEHVLVQSLIHGIVEIDRNQKYVTTWGTDGSYDKCLKAPRQIFISSDNYVYIVNGEKPTIQRYNMEGKFIDIFLKTNNLDGSPLGIQDICEDSEGNIVLLTYLKDAPILTIDKSGYFIRRLPSYPLDFFYNKINLELKAHNGMFKDDSYYLSGHREKQVSKTISGSIPIYFNSIIPMPDESYVVDFAVNNGEQVTIAYWNHSIQKFDKNGVFLNYLIKPEIHPEENRDFHSIAIDQFDNTFILTRACKIQIYNNKGILDQIIDVSDRIASCHGDEKIAVSKDGRNLLVTDLRNFRVLIFKR
ncbi:MAG TPA: hypothetical protein PKD16_17420 [Saprospiraceae bacterium]|jgi:sugar lactone lactonase YvrE|nr:hypothetical protein [Saprospiraceae bacterium]HMT71953.1 hypothetical protein [Saprospiraceae bacterium]